jgi:hypothetical protein
MFRLLSFITLFSFATALKPTFDASPSKVVIRPATAPLNDLPLFDLNVVGKGIQPSFLREAELKHGRLAMVASVVIPLVEIYTDDLGINQFQKFPDSVQLSLVALMFVSEFSSMLRGWENPTVKLFRLKEDYQPGDFGFALWNKDDVKMGVLMDKELNNGRLAMFGVLGMIVQELVTQKQLL